VDDVLDNFLNPDKWLNSPKEGELA